MVSTHTRNVAMVFSLAVFCAALIGCSSSDDGRVAELEGQLDMTEAARMTAEEQVAMLRAQVETLMGRADITPEDVAALRTQVEMLMGRADITPEDVAALRAQVEMLMGRADITPEDVAALRTQVDTLMGRADITPEGVAALRAQVDTLMGRADITPEDVAALRAQVDTLMGRADITPEDVAALRTQVETLMGRAETAEQALADARFDAAVGNVIEKVTAHSMSQVYDAEDGYIRHTGGRIRQSDAFSDSGTEASSVSQLEEDASGSGEPVNLAVVWRGNDGEVDFLVDISGAPIRNGNATTWPNSSRLHGGRQVDDIAGAAIVSSGVIQDHGLGSPWQGFEATKAYDGAGELTARLFTDLGASEDAAHPYDWELDMPDVEIALTDARVPVFTSLPGRDGVYVVMPPDGLAGSLAGIAGRFTCTGGHCSFLYNRTGFAGYAPWVDSAPVLFTPDGGGQTTTIPPVAYATPSASVPKEDYLVFGSWLYVPEDVTDLDAFRFGLYASGDDPFRSANLMGLAGTATYAGKAAGMYVAPVVSAVDTFSADVELNADFGSGSELGTISGAVTNFALGSGAAAPLNTLELRAYDHDGDGHTIYARPPWWDDQAGFMRGGFIEGDTGSSPDGHWWGNWGGKFFGNGSGPTDHPTSFAGTFGATDGERSFAGSFGAHAQ